MQSEKELRQWINDLQTGMYINCVYCGHRYGPNSEEIPADALRRHVASCPEHPLGILVSQCEFIVGTIFLTEKIAKDSLTDLEKSILKSLLKAIEKAKS